MFKPRLEFVQLLLPLGGAWRCTGNDRGHIATRDTNGMFVQQFGRHINAKRRRNAGIERYRIVADGAILAQQSAEVGIGNGISVASDE
ncbi:hypothetical protein CJ255_22080 [Candidatus Viridilinea mediisalina]|uniref:Uncharacterized protein n=1 Tax=Candidatus Viridilinea mediisalina TaxID=2024553 RepID=A0A2A6RCQ5_9CHLR|nr:hypothetical protein CJ255_22080 [Candidatus Viridilinea mediisalina]